MTQKIILLIIAISFVAAIYLYPQMPEQMASHWSAQGEVNGYLSKCWGLFLMPLISLVVFLLFLIIPKIDPLKKNIEKFRNYFNLFIILIILFLLYIHTLSIFWNLGYRFNMGQMMMPALAVLFFFIGIILKHAKRNWFIGIRTPWTLSNDTVWDKTHQIGSKLFKFAALIILIAAFLPGQTIWFLLILIIAIVLYLFIYSYLIYPKEK